MLVRLGGGLGSCHLAEHPDEVDEPLGSVEDLTPVYVLNPQVRDLVLRLVQVRLEARDHDPHLLLLTLGSLIQVVRRVVRHVSTSLLFLVSSWRH